MKINSVTPKRVAEIRKSELKYHLLEFKTVPEDQRLEAREDAQHAVTKLFQQLKRPLDSVIWTESPMEAYRLVLSSARKVEIGHGVKNTRTYELLEEAIEPYIFADTDDRYQLNDLAESYWYEYTACTGHAIAHGVEKDLLIEEGLVTPMTQLWTSLTCRALMTLVSSDVDPNSRREALIRSYMTGGFVGQRVNTVSRYDTYHMLGVDFGVLSHHDSWCEIVQNVHFFFPVGDVVILSDFPTALDVETHTPRWGFTTSRFHNAKGPAIVYASQGQWFWHGVRVPKWIIEHPESITRARITTEMNQEVRRVMLERFGYERFLREGNASLIGVDDWGKLWHCPVPNDEPLAMVEVLNSTPEPDGTFKTYFIRVPPGRGIDTPLQAISWSFGMTEHEYSRLAAQT